MHCERMTCRDVGKSITRITLVAVVLLLLVCTSVATCAAHLGPKAAGAVHPGTGTTGAAHPGPGAMGAAYPVAVPRGEERAIIIDTDMGLDDVRAIFALLAADVDIHAIVTVEGSAAVGKGTDNLVGLLESIPRHDILVFRGAISPLQEPPPWRHTANTLGGGTFPPPRRLESRSITPEALARMLERENEQFNYLALGPLCNPAALLREHPGTFSVIETVWIPAKIDSEGTVTGWNLQWDPKAAVSVLRETPDVVLIDLTDVGTIDAYTILAEAANRATGETGRPVTDADASLAARWIARTLSGSDDERAHLFIHDELAAAALIAPELISISSESHRASFAANGDITLERHGKGNIRIARIRDLSRATDLLNSLWQLQIHAGHEHAAEHHIYEKERAGEDHLHGTEHTVENQIHGIEHGADEHRIQTELLLRTFHGHLGPYVVLGYRMGQLALETTGSTGHFGISAEVHSILEPPHSCLIDGIQLGSGCTLGKRNIAIVETDGPAHVLFTTTEGVKIRIALKQAVPELVTRLVDELGVEAAGREILEMETEDLFEIEIEKPAGEHK